MILLVGKFYRIYYITQTTEQYWTSDRTLMWLAIIISIVSLIFSVVFSRITINITRNHNKKSVRPIIQSKISIDLNKKFELKLVNNGTGPAIIKSVEYNLDGKTYTDFGVLYDNHLIQNKNDKYENHHRNHTFLSGISIKEGCESSTIQMYLDDNVCIEKMGKLMDNIQIKVLYTSIYNEEFIHA